MNIEAKSMYYKEEGEWLELSLNALEKANELEYWYGSAASLRNLGAYYFVKGQNFEKALDYYLDGFYRAKYGLQKADSEEFKTKLTFELYYQSYQISNLFRKIGLPEEGYKFSLLADEYLSRTEYKPYDRVLLKISRGFILNELELYAESLAVFKEGVEYCKDNLESDQKGVQGLLVDLYCIIVGIYCSIGDFDQALLYSEKAIKSSTDVELSILINGAYYRKGQALIGIGLYEEALSNGNLGLTMSKTALDSSLHNITLGKGYFQLQEYDKAQQFLEPLIDWHRKAHDDKSLASTLNMLKSIYIKNKNTLKLKKIDSLFLSIEKGDEKNRLNQKFESILREKETWLHKRMAFDDKVEKYLYFLLSAFIFGSAIAFRSLSKHTVKNL